MAEKRALVVAGTDTVPVSISPAVVISEVTHDDASIVVTVAMPMETSSVVVTMEAAASAMETTASRPPALGRSRICIDDGNAGQNK